jgi:predicted nucleic acid-binding protein
MRIAIDTSALIAVMVNQVEKSLIIGITQGAELIAPSSVKWEIGNALSSLYKRNKILENQLDEAINSFNHIPIHFEHPDLKEVLKICVKHQMYAYDAYVIACAKDFHVPILTLDLAMKSIAGKEHVKVMEI